MLGVSLDGTGVFGHSNSSFAGDFDGNVRVTGNLSKGGGSFKIDHPLNPENKPIQERGYYLHPDAFGQPPEKSVQSAVHPELTQRLKEMRTQPAAKPPKQ